ncbi:MAG: polysaccharide deacetylase family protein [Candidatus Methanofastidiosa archaeon]|nr:polysaccharide deacetylase family protein [Candidatus Methanofastidiosa archaeon]
MGLQRTCMAFFLFVVLAGASTGCLLGGDEGEPPIYVAITIDTERDYPPYFDTYRGIDEGIPRLTALLDEYGVRATFFVTGMVALHRPDVVRDLALSHEVGCHSLYHNEALYSLSYEEKEERMAAATQLLEALVGKPIVSFRSPYHSGDTDLMHILEDLGYTSEGSARKAGSYPYHPASDDWNVPGDMDILRIPVSNVPSYCYSFFLYDSSFVAAYEYAVAAQETRDITVVVIGLHPWEFCEMETGSEQWDRICGDVTYTMLADLFAYLSDKNVRYVTYAEIVELFS